MEEGWKNLADILKENPRIPAPAPSRGNEPAKGLTFTGKISIIESLILALLPEGRVPCERAAEKSQ